MQNYIIDYFLLINNILVLNYNLHRNTKFLRKIEKCIMFNMKQVECAVFKSCM